MIWYIHGTATEETLYTYDQEHNPVRTMEKIKEGKWKETARKYDFRGRCILERDALGNESLKEYEANRAYPSRVITPKKRGRGLPTATIP